MKKDIILAGVGGQGILTIATIIGYAAIESGYDLKQAEVHGMSQRGGDVQSNLRISDKTIYSDLIPKGKCDVILSVEPMEALRYIPYLSENGWIISNSTPFKNIPNYPNENDLVNEIKKFNNHVVLNADNIAKENATARAMNIVMLGAAANVIGLDYEQLEAGIRFIFDRKGEDVVHANLKALKAGKTFAENYR